MVSGALDSRVGGPSIAMTPLATRRTIYGRVSRYKLDEFLQLFDFPSPSQTAEQRFSTNVPLQRLFFMNSDFMQQHAERLADSVADEPDDTARIEKVYRKLFGRAPTADEIKAGRDFLQAEAFKQYEDRKAEAKRDPSADEASKRAGTAADLSTASDAPEKDGAEREEAAEPSADGMMAGVTPGARAPDADKEKMRPVSTFGRYVKILLSSNEFIFVS
jgi:hypothetical protein